MNSLAIIKGNLGRDPELRTTASGLKVATYSVAVYRPNPKDKDKPLTDWFNVIAWGDQADLVMEHLKKGTKVLLTGKFQTRSYQDKEGKNVSLTEFMQDEFYLVPAKVENKFTGSITHSDEELPF